MGVQQVDLLGGERQSTLRTREVSGANAVAETAAVHPVAAGQHMGRRCHRGDEALEADAAETFTRLG